MFGLRTGAAKARQELAMARAPGRAFMLVEGARATCLVAAYALACTGALAQSARPATPAPPTGATPPPEQAAQEGLRREEERARERRRALQPEASELRPARPEAAPAMPRETPCFVVEEIRLSGPDAARFRWLNDAALPWLRQCVGARGLSVIAAGLDHALQDAGYATSRVLLGPQSLRDGVLDVRVDAGRVAEVRMVGGDDPLRMPDRRWGTWRNAFPVSTGDLLNVHDLEQGVENMKRLASQTVGTRLEPGEGPGESIVVIERKPTDEEGLAGGRVRGGVTLDNAGSAALGRAQLSASLALDNPLGLSDLLSASLNTNAQRPGATHRSQSAALNYSVPWGYNLLSASVSHSRFAQYVQGTTVRFLSSGSSDSAELRAARTLWRGTSGRIGVYAALSQRRAESYLDDVEIIVQRRRTTSVETGANLRKLYEGAVLDVDMAYRRGMPWGGAQDDLATASAGGLTLRPHLWLLSASIAGEAKVAGLSVQYTSALRLQRTGDTTLSTDQIAIGGRSSVRGFDGDAVLIAESGAVLRSEVSTPLVLWDGVATQAVVALDVGRVHGASDVLLAGHSLAGLATGLRGRWRGLQYEALLAVPLRHPPGFQTRPYSLYATLTQTF